MNCSAILNSGGLILTCYRELELMQPSCRLAPPEVLSSPFQARFTGPFTVLRQVSEQNYLLSTPKRRKSTQLCHVNLLKPYFERVPPVSDSSGKEQDRSVRSVSVAATVESSSPQHWVVPFWL